MDLETRYIKAALKAEILNVAASLDSDKVYTKEQAVKELVKIVEDFFER